MSGVEGLELSPRNESESEKLVGYFLPLGANVREKYGGNSKAAENILHPNFSGCKIFLN